MISYKKEANKKERTGDWSKELCDPCADDEKSKSLEFGGEGKMNHPRAETEQSSDEVVIG